MASPEESPYYMKAEAAAYPQARRGGAGKRKPHVIDWL